MHLFSVEARVGDHNSCDALDYGIVVGRHVDAKQSVHARHSIVHVDASGCTTIADVVLGARCNLLSADNKCLSDQFLTTVKN